MKRSRFFMAASSFRYCCVLHICNPDHFSVSFTANFPQSWSWRRFADFVTAGELLDTWAENGENQSMLKLSPAMMETSCAASLPPRWNGGQIRVTGLLTERINDTQWTHTHTQKTGCPDSSHLWIHVFLVPPFTCCSCLIRTSGVFSPSIISCFSSLSSTDCLSEEPVCRWCLTWLRVLAGVDQCVVSLWLSDVEGCCQPLSGRVLTHSSLCHRHISDRSVQSS